MAKDSQKGSRDETKTVSQHAFANTLRRIADALEHGERRRIQVRGERISIPQRAVCSIEHEREDATEEVELQITWGHEDKTSTGA